MFDNELKKNNLAGQSEKSDDSDVSAAQIELRNEKLKIITFRVHEKKLQDIWNQFESRHIKPVLIKGWAAASNYPKPYARRFGDFDLAVNPSDFEQAVGMRRSLHLDEVDLHRGLRYLDTLEWDKLFADAVFAECGETKIRVLKPEDHLRVLCVHWLVDGGREREKLWDIFYAVEKRPADFDWDRCLNVVSEKRRKWIIYTIGLVNKYLGLAIDDLPFAGQAKRLPKWLTETVEREWNNPVEFRYLRSCLNSRKDFFRQLSRRFPPNPIQATVNMEGDLDSSTRIFYQVQDVLVRLTPSVRRVFGAFYARLLGRN